MVFRTRDLFVRQRTQSINALRAHLVKHWTVAPQGVWNLPGIQRLINETGSDIEPLVIEMSPLYLAQITAMSAEITSLEAVLTKEAEQSDASSRMMTMPGLGPITATAIEAFAPALTVFRNSRDLAAWLGLVPRQHSSGGKQVLGRTSKIGQRDLRPFLITGAMSVIRWASRRGAAPGSWLHAMLLRKPRMVVAIAFANKMARVLWAMEIRKEVYRDPQLATV